MTVGKTSRSTSPERTGSNQGASGSLDAHESKSEPSGEFDVAMSEDEEPGTGKVNAQSANETAGRLQQDIPTDSPIHRIGNSGRALALEVAKEIGKVVGYTVAGGVVGGIAAGLAQSVDPVSRGLIAGTPALVGLVTGTLTALVKRGYICAPPAYSPSVTSPANQPV